MERNSRKKENKGKVHHGMMLKEWRKRVKMTQEEVIKRKLLNCPHFYSNIEIKYRQETGRLCESWLHGIRYLWQPEKREPITLFSLVKIRSGKMGVYLLKIERLNGMGRQDYSRNMEVQSVLKSENAQIKVRKAWSECCVGKESTQPHHLWEKSTEPRLGYCN